MADRSPLFHIRSLLTLEKRRHACIHVAIYGSYMPSRHLRRLDTPLQAPKHLAEWDIGILIASAWIWDLLAGHACAVNTPEMID